MVSDFKLERRSWWGNLDKDLKELLTTSVLLVGRVSKWEAELHDFSFVVFPAAKAYEGFLKNVFLERGFINEKDYYGKRFRVGKALNPALRKRLRQESVFQKVADFCGDEALAVTMWETWKQCRNLLFHWFPREKNAVSFAEARERIMKIITTMDAVEKECKIN